MSASGDGAQSGLADVYAQLARLLDLEAIRVLLARYNQGYDLPDMDLLAGLFCEDGELRVGESVWRGRAHIHADIGARRHLFGETRHFSPLNLQVEFDGPERARAESAFLVRRIVEGQHVWNSGEYEDRLRRVDGAWLFEARTIRRHEPTTIPVPPAPARIG